MPDRADKVMHQIENCHGGSLYDSRYGTRMHGEWKRADQINTLVRLAKHKYIKDKNMPKLNCELHKPFKNGQWRLF